MCKVCWKLILKLKHDPCLWIPPDFKSLLLLCMRGTRNRAYFKRLLARLLVVVLVVSFGKVFTVWFAEISIFAFIFADMSKKERKSPVWERFTCYEKYYHFWLVFLTDRENKDYQLVINNESLHALCETCDFIKSQQSNYTVHMW